MPRRYMQSDVQCKASREWRFRWRTVGERGPSNQLQTIRHCHHCQLNHLRKFLRCSMILPIFLQGIPSGPVRAFPRVGRARSVDAVIPAGDDV